MIVAPDSKTFDGSIPKAYAGLLLKSWLRKHKNMRKIRLISVF